MAKKWDPHKSLTMKYIMARLARDLIKCVFLHFTKTEKDVYGTKMPRYSKVYGDRKRAKKFDRQADRWANKRSPVLTQAFMQDLQDSGDSLKHGEWGFEIGWFKEGYKGIALNKMGRRISTSDRPVPKKCENTMYGNYAVNIEKDMMTRIPKKTVAKINL
tara:strand:+ start:4259 stop:4738 length:480 start_codon:yes stop_codon:yes gene_type:complete